jgi:hypothetical protein
VKELARRAALEVGAAAPRGQLDLRKVTSKLLSPLDVCRTLAAPIAAAEMAAPNFSRNIHGELMRPHTELEGAARELAAVLPAYHVVEAALEVINRALGEPCDVDTARVLVGALLAGYGVKPGEDAEIRLTAMVIAVEDLLDEDGRPPVPASAPVIAAAVLDAWRRGGAFAPSPGEFVNLCRKYRSRLRVRRRGVLQLIQARQDVEEVLDEIEF